jgi:hypothetical protein
VPTVLTRLLCSKGDSSSDSLLLEVPFSLRSSSHSLTAPACSHHHPRLAPFGGLAQPVNVNCTAAIIFTPKTENTDVVTGSTISGIMGPYLGNCPPYTTTAPTLFYSFEGTGSKIKISTCSASTDFATAITLATGCGGGDCITASDGDLDCTTTSNAAAITFDSVLATSYIVVVYGRQTGLEGNFGLRALEYTPPVNNECTNAISFLPIITEDTVRTGSTINATAGPYLGNCPPYTTTAPTVFYSFEGTGSKIKISTCSASTGFATAITLATGCGSGDCIAASDGDLECTTTANAAAITFDSVLATTYSVAVYGRQTGLEGNFGLSALEYIPPGNNECTNAASFQPGSSVVGYTVNATVGPYVGNVMPYTNVCPTVWYSVLGNGNTFKATTCSDVTNYNTAITVTVVTSGCGSALVSSDVDVSCSSNAGASAVTWNTTSGTRYNIVVHGRAVGDEGDFEITVIDLSNPVTRGPVVASTPPPTTPAPVSTDTTPPMSSPTMAPTTSEPNISPTMAHTTSEPIISPTMAPTTSEPIISPTKAPTTSTDSPMISPTKAPITSEAVHHSWLWLAFLTAIVGWAV